MEQYIIDTGLEKDINIMQKWVNTYSHEDSMPMEKYLMDWHIGKSKYLFKLFGNQLIHKYPIEYGKSTSEIKQILENKFNKDDTYTFLYQNFDKMLSYYIFGYKDPYDDPRNHHFWWRQNATEEQKRERKEWEKDIGIFDNCSCLFGLHTLAANEVSYAANKKELKITISQGQKPFRAINNLVNIMKKPLLEKYPSIFNEQFFNNFEENFEKLRIIHSQALNNKKVKGTLCLSIHPLDYMTMSDNNYDWTSCMRWRDSDDEAGCYHAGTLEMMNSANVIVAYLEGEEPWYPFFRTEGTISNKKWRELFIVDHDFIIGIKGYPYIHQELETYTINILSEMAKNQLNFSYNNDIIRYYGNHIKYNDKVDFHLETYHFMYNDIEGNGCRIKWSTDPTFKNITDGEYFYGARAYCTVCGDELDNEERTICRDHANIHICCECERELCNVDDAVEVNGNYYCYDCYYANFSECKLCEEVIDRNEENVYRLCMIYKGMPTNSIAQICSNCLDILQKKKYVREANGILYVTKKCPEETIKNLFDIPFMEYLAYPEKFNIEFVEEPTFNAPSQNFDVLSDIATLT